MVISPKSFIGQKVSAVEVNKMKLGDPDAGRRKPVIEKGNYKIEADIVIKSLGFDPENIPKLFNVKKVSSIQMGNN